MSHVVLLDKEAVQALADPHHRKHRRVLSHAQVVAHRRRRTAIQTVIPTSVRVEAGWDRTAPRSAFLNRLRITDLPLDATHANVAAELRSRLGVSVADAHLGAVIATTTADRITVITSDPGDIRAVAGTVRITTVAI